jgi:hypothetical protein
MWLVCPRCDAQVFVADGARDRSAACAKCGFVVAGPARAEDGITEAHQDDVYSVAPQEPRRPDYDIEPSPRRRGFDFEDDDDDDDEFGTIRIPRVEQSSLSLTAMIFGITSAVSGSVGACCCGIFIAPITAVCAITAIVLGIMGLSRGSRGFALAGIILGSVSLLLALAWTVFFIAVGGADLVGNVFRGKF